MYKFQGAVCVFSNIFNDKFNGKPNDHVKDNDNV